MKARIRKFLSERIGYLIILLLRRYQDKLYEQITIQQTKIDGAREGSFSEVFSILAYHGCKTLYWFCVANSWVKGQTPRKE